MGAERFILPEGRFVQSKSRAREVANLFIGTYPRRVRSSLERARFGGYSEGYQAAIEDMKGGK